MIARTIRCGGQKAIQHFVNIKHVCQLGVNLFLAECENNNELTCHSVFNDLDLWYIKRLDRSLSSTITTGNKLLDFPHKKNYR